MDIQEHETPWIKRIEELIQVLEGSTIGELELTEAGTEIIIRRRPGMMISVPAQQPGLARLEQPLAAAHSAKDDRSVAIIAPLTGVFYAAPSPTSPPFVSPGDVVHAGQVIALVEAMKVFNEIQSEIAGRVIEIVATNGNVMQKGDVLIKIEPL